MQEDHTKFYYRGSGSDLFEIKYIDHTPTGSWVHYVKKDDKSKHEYSCLAEAFHQRFRKVEK